MYKLTQKFKIHTGKLAFYFIYEGGREQNQIWSRTQKGQKLHACVLNSQNKGGVVIPCFEDGWKTLQFCSSPCDFCPLWQLCARRQTLIPVGWAWLCALLSMHGYGVFCSCSSPFLKNKSTVIEWFTIAYLSCRKIYVWVYGVELRIVKSAGNYVTINIVPHYAPLNCLYCGADPVIQSP